MDVEKLIEKIGEKEASITKRVFISPVFFNTQVATTVYGIIYTFDIPVKDPGWYRIKPIDIHRARVTGPADMPEIEQYLKRLKKIRAVTAFKKDGVYHCIVEKQAQEIGGMTLPVYLADDTLSDFERVICRFDGANLWYESVDAANDISKAGYLRESLPKLIEPQKIKYPGLLFEEKAAYAFRVSIDRKFIEEQKKTQVQRDVEHAGGKFVKFDERRDFISVTYAVDGHQYTSYVSKDPKHMVITAGVCLQGGDAAFDLKSLVTVLREGQRIDMIHRYNNTF